MDLLFKREFNTKCLVISGAVVTAYVVLPKRNLWVGAGLALATYVLIAWYDKLYNCDDKLIAFGGLFGEVTGPFKPSVVGNVYGGSMKEGTPGC